MLKKSGGTDGISIAFIFAGMVKLGIHFFLPIPRTNFCVCLQMAEASIFSLQKFPTYLCRGRESNSRQSCTSLGDLLRTLYQLSYTTATNLKHVNRALEQNLGLTTSKTRFAQSCK